MDTLRCRQLTLLELLDRALTKGVVLHGDLTISLADVDLLYIGLRLIIAAVDVISDDLAALPG